MKNRSRRSSRWLHQPDINLNAFLDLILNILLFFIFTTELAIFDAVEVAVPVTEYSDSLSDAAQIPVIFISGDNRYWADGEPIALENLAAWLSGKRHNGAIQDSVIVRGDLHSSLQSMVDVLGACRLAGIAKIKIETEKPSS